jgi:cystathionine beta-synthase
MLTPQPARKLPPLSSSKSYPTIFDAIGNTPMIRVNVAAPCTFLAKLEYTNPGGSIKDRAANYMIAQAEKQGLLKPGGTIIEASSGNQGIALAMIGATKGYEVIIILPDRTSSEKIATLKAYGAKVMLCPNTDDLHDSHSYHTYAERLLKTIPGAWMPNQYYNVANPQAHYETTGPEIWEQTGGALTHMFIGMGSCGTITGVGRYLKERNPHIKIIGIDAETSALSAKEPKAYNSEGIGVDVISDTLDRSVIDEIITINDEDAFDATRRIAKNYGLLCGISSGAVMHVAENYAQKLFPTDVASVILADSGRAYLSKVFTEK